MRAFGIVSIVLSLTAALAAQTPAPQGGRGLFGIEIEATTKVSVRSMWVKKLN